MTTTTTKKKKKNKEEYDEDEEDKDEDEDGEEGQLVTFNSSRSIHHKAWIFTWSPRHSQVVIAVYAWRVDR